MDFKIKRVVLHIGPDKTGSTSIQHTFRDNSDFFKQFNVFYSTNYSHNDKGMFLWFADEVLVNTTVETPRAGHKDLIHNYKQSFEQRMSLLPSDATWVLSHEGLIHLKKEALMNLRQFLFNIANEILVVFYVRDPLSYAISAKSQRIKTGRSNTWRKPLYIKYAELLPNFVEVFGIANIEARLFDKNRFKCGDVFLDFINSKWAENKFSAIQDVFKSSFLPNLSLDTESYLLLKDLSEIFHSKGICQKEFRKHFSGYWRHSGKPLKLSPLEALMVIHFSRRHYSYLKHNFGIQLDLNFGQRIDFSICRHFVSEIRAQRIVKNGHFPSKPDRLERIIRLAASIIHDAMLLPICFMRLFRDKKPTN